MAEEMIEVPKGLVELIHRLAQRIKTKHGGWYESYATSDEIKVINYSDLLKKERKWPDKE